MVAAPLVDATSAGSGAAGAAARPGRRGRPPGGRGARGGGRGRTRRPPAPPDVQPEARHLDPQLVELGLVDDPQDLADVVVREPHQPPPPPAPNLPMIIDSADAGACSALSSFFAAPVAVTGRDCTTRRSPSCASAHSTSWCEPKYLCTRRATSTSAASSGSSRDASDRRASSTATQTVPQPDG